MTCVFHLRPATPNIGNDLISIAMEAMLRAALEGHVNLVTLPAGSGHGIKESGLSAGGVYQINQLADGVIIGPGNLFENGSLHVDPVALDALQVPAVLFSVSYGRVYDRFGRLAARTDSLSPDKIKAVCRKVERPLVRDDATRRHLEILGVERGRVIGCPTLFLNEADLPLPLPEPAVAGSALISVRHPKLMSVPYALQGRVQQDVSRIIDELRRRGEHVQILCHDYQDLPFARSFDDVPLLYTENPYRFLGWLRSCRLSITYRLHAFLPCLSLGVPSIHLSYDERAASLIETVGVAPWDVSLIHSPDVLADVRQRLDSLPRLDELKAKARPIWGELRAGIQEELLMLAARMNQTPARRCRLAA